jgi:hypothetical protein
MDRRSTKGGGYEKDLHKGLVDILLQPDLVVIARREASRTMRGRGCRLLVDWLVGTASSSTHDDGADVVKVVAEVELACWDI